jgi:hypothetical protein
VQRAKAMVWTYLVFCAVRASASAHEAWTSGGKRSLRPMTRIWTPCCCNSALSEALDRVSFATVCGRKRKNERGAPVLANFDEPSPGHVEQGIDLVRVAVKVLDREGIDGHVGDVEFEEETKDALERLEAFLVSDSDGQVPDAGAAAVPVHDEGDVFWSRAEAEGRDDEGAEERVERSGDPREAGRERQVDVAGWWRGRVFIFGNVGWSASIRLYDVRYDEHPRRVGEREKRVKWTPFKQIGMTPVQFRVRRNGSSCMKFLAPVNLLLARLWRAWWVECGQEARRSS